MFHFTGFSRACRSLLYYFCSADDNFSKLNDYMRSLSSHTKRTEPHRPVTVELALYTDSLFTKRLPSKDPSKRIELMIVKYNGVKFLYL